MSNIEYTVSTPRTDYYVIRSAACMPNSCWGKYENVAIISQPSGARPPRQIRETARGSVRVYRSKLFSGSTERCAAERAVADLIDRADRMAARERACMQIEASDMHRTEGA